MTPRRDAACAICGLVASAHLTALTAIESAHPHAGASQPTISDVGLPPEPTHDHRDFVGVVRIVDAGFVDGSRGALAEEVDDFTLPNMARIARRNYERWWKPMYAPWLSSGDELPLAGHVTAEWGG
jgi:hypothetical protein